MYIWIVAAVFLASGVYYLVMLKKLGLLGEKKRRLFPVIDLSFCGLLVLLALFKKTGTWLEYVLLTICFGYILCRRHYVKKILVTAAREREQAEKKKGED